MFQRLAISQDRHAQLASLINTLCAGFVLHGTRNFNGTGRIGHQLLHCLGQTLSHFVKAHHAIGSTDTVTRHVNVLRGGTHLAGVQRKGERQVAGNRLEILNRINNHLIHTSFFGVDQGVASIFFQPVTVLAAAGKVDQLDGLVQCQLLGGVFRWLVSGQQDHIRIEAGFGQHFAGDSNGNGQRQNRARVRLHNYGVTGCQRGKQTGVTVPGREGGATNHQTNATGHDFELFLHLDGIVLALGLDPVNQTGDTGHFLPGVGHGFQRTLLGVRATGLEGHHEALTRGVLHSVSDLEAALIQAMQDFQANTHPGLRASIAPAVQRQLRLSQQLVHRHFGVANAQIKTKRRLLVADFTLCAFQRQGKGFATVGFKSSLTILSRGFTVGARAGIFRISAPEVALQNTAQSLIQRCLMRLEKICCHTMCS